MSAVKNAPSRQEDRAAEEEVYMDDRALAAGQIMIRFTPDPMQQLIPSRVGPLQLNTLGPGSVIGGSVSYLTVEEGYTRLLPGSISAGVLKMLKLPYTVQEVAPGFLTGSPSAEILFRRRLTAGELASLRDISLPAGGGMRLLTGSQLTGEELGPVAAALSSLAPPLPVLNDRMAALMLDTPGTQIFSARPCFNLLGPETRTEEAALVQQMIRQQFFGWRHPGAELQSDRRVRAGLLPPPHPEALALAEFDPGKAVLRPDGCYDVTVHLLSRAMAVPALLPVALEEKQFYLYSRQHLVSKTDCPYWREDIGIFDADGLVTDQKLSEAVYAKARLPRLL